MAGLRGVGKTVLLNRIRSQAEALGIVAPWFEADETRSLPSLLVPQLRSVLLRLSRRESARDLARRSLGALAGFVGTLQVRYEGFEIGLDISPELGIADSGDLTADMQSLMESVGEAAQAAEVCVAFFVDEIQYVASQELAPLIAALHRVSQLQLPITMIAAGLPQTHGVVGQSKSYAERLFEFVDVGQLERVHAQSAITVPLANAGVDIEESALANILIQTDRYPYFLQEWGKHAWDAALASPITVADVESASGLAFEDLEAGFFRVRLERVSASERTYLRAMAELGSGPYPSGDVAEVMKREVSSIAPIRRNLIAKGMIWSPSRGFANFTVPMFDRFLRRNVSLPE